MLKLQNEQLPSAISQNNNNNNQNQNQNHHHQRQRISGDIIIIVVNIIDIIIDDAIPAGSHSVENSPNEDNTGDQQLLHNQQ